MELSELIDEGNKEEVAKMIEKDDSLVNRLDYSGLTPLFRSLYRDHLSIFKVPLSPFDFSLLACLFEKPFLSFFFFFFKKNKFIIGFLFPFSFYLVFFPWSFLKLLLEHPKINVQQTNLNGRTPLLYAWRKGKKEYFDLITHHSLVFFLLFFFLAFFLFNILRPSMNHTSMFLF